MSSFQTPLKLEYVDGSTWKVDAPFRYDVGAENSGESIIVPAGTSTDFASIPRLFWRILPPTGQYGKAAVVHDYLYQNCGLIEESAGHIRIYTRDRCDQIFLEAMTVLGVPKWKRQAMYWAVRSAGFVAWNGHAKRIAANEQTHQETTRS